MTHSWIEIELQDKWTLSSDEMALLPGMTDKGRLGFAAQLKFMQIHGRFPERHEEIDPNATQWLGAQIGAPVAMLSAYELDGRQGRRHRQTIRSFLGFRPATGKDLKALGQWLSHPPVNRYSMVAMFCWRRRKQLTDLLLDLLLQVTHHLGTRAEKKIDQRHFTQFKKVRGKAQLLFKLAETTVDQPDGIIKDVIYPVVSQKTLQDIVAEFKAMGFNFDREVQERMRSSTRRSHRYSHARSTGT